MGSPESEQERQLNKSNKDFHLIDGIVDTASLLIPRLKSLQGLRRENIDYNP